MPRRFTFLHAILLAIAAAAIVLPVLVVLNPPAIPRALPMAPTRARVVPPAIVPPVEPVEYRELEPEDALSFNAAVPFSSAPNPPAKPFRFFGGKADLDRARDCLAAAMWYEAGDDPTGERAVGQVVLNRVRHPAFPSTVCGVVFQGQERRTGCQFTFTCDGALVRTPSPEAWERARSLAGAAIGGTVYSAVGTATHYHTNWVVPYWSSSLDKIVEVHSHLFFRWSGWWGTPPAFRERQSGAEPAIAKLARLSPAHAGAVPQSAADLAMAGALSLTGTTANAVRGDPDTFIAQLDPAQPPELYRVLALATCGDRPRCKFMGWTDRRAMPATLPLTPGQVGAMAFSYLRDREGGFEKPLWNCQLFPDTPPASCMRRQQVLTAVPVQGRPDQSTTAPIAGAAVAPGSPTGWEGLFGVRRAADEPAPAPTPGTARSGRAGATAPPAAPASPVPAVRRPRTAPAPTPSPTPPRPRSGDAASRPPA